MIADGLAIYHETNLGVITERMKKAVGVSGDTSAAISDRLAQCAAWIERRKLQKAGAVDVLVRGWVRLDDRAVRFYSDRGGRPFHVQGQVHSYRPSAPYY